MYNKFAIISETERDQSKTEQMFLVTNCETLIFKNLNLPFSLTPFGEGEIKQYKISHLAHDQGICTISGE